MDRHRYEHRGRAICKALQIAPSTYYARRHRHDSARTVSDRELGEKIESIHAGNYGVYRARKIREDLVERRFQLRRRTGCGLPTSPFVQTADEITLRSRLTSRLVAGIVTGLTAGLRAVSRIAAAADFS